MTFYRGQAVREKATGKLWYVTNVFRRSMTNIEHILSDLRALGVVFTLHANRFTYSDPGLSEEHKTGITVCRESILEQLRTESGVCIACGEEKAAHPSYIGYAGKKGTPLEHVRKDTPLEKRKPLLYCSACYHYGGWRKAWPKDYFERK